MKSNHTLFCDSYLLNNLPSRNGTYLNGTKLEPEIAQELNENNSITLAIPSTTHSHYDPNSE